MAQTFQLQKSEVTLYFLSSLIVFIQHMNQMIMPFNNSILLSKKNWVVFDLVYMNKLVMT